MPKASSDTTGGLEHRILLIISPSTILPVTTNKYAQHPTILTVTKDPEYTKLFENKRTREKILTNAFVKKLLLTPKFNKVAATSA